MKKIVTILSLCVSSSYAVQEKDNSNSCLKEAAAAVYRLQNRYVSELDSATFVNPTTIKVTILNPETCQAQDSLIKFNTNSFCQAQNISSIQVGLTYVESNCIKKPRAHVAD